MEETKQVYDIDYFIEKFNAIPEDNWATGECVEKRWSSELHEAVPTGRYCALGHCGMKSLGEDYNTEEALQLIEIFRKGLDKYHVQNSYSLIYNVNDNTDKIFHESTPKQRILSQLKLIKNGK